MSDRFPLVMAMFFAGFFIENLDDVFQVCMVSWWRWWFSDQEQAKQTVQVNLPSQTRVTFGSSCLFSLSSDARVSCRRQRKSRLHHHRLAQVCRERSVHLALHKYVKPSKMRKRGDVVFICFVRCPDVSFAPLMVDSSDLSLIWLSGNKLINEILLFPHLFNQSDGSCSAWVSRTLSSDSSPDQRWKLLRQTCLYEKRQNCSWKLQAFNHLLMLDTSVLGDMEHFFCFAF